MGSKTPPPWTPNLDLNSVFTLPPGGGTFLEVVSCALKCEVVFAQQSSNLESVSGVMLQTNSQSQNETEFDER